MSNRKQLIQVSNIFNTLLEATEHFHQLIKQKELNQSIYIFSSIVDGFTAVGSMDILFNQADWNEQKQKAERYLLEIAESMEKGHFIKVSEILQFSLLPLFRKINKGIELELGDQIQDKTYSIGIFSSYKNPREIYPKERIEALVRESKKQNTELLFFSKNDVDFANKTVAADFYNNGNWERVIKPFPDVINNVGSVKQAHTEKKLRRFIPFTSFFVGNKLSLPKRIVQHRKFIELLVPFRVCSDEEKIYDFLEKNDKVVFKYLLSNRGENIYFITKKNNRFILLDHKKERILSNEAFEQWIKSVILKEKDSYIIQKYIHTRTKNNEPYHIRAHVQKDGEGKWVLTHIYPRVGNKKSNLSNVATEGRVENLHDFMVHEYGEITGSKYEKDILRLSIEVAQHLDKLYDLALDELGIDFAIDENGKYWMHEANNGPQTAYHEEKRAVNTIAYAKYIAKNGIFHTNYSQKMKAGFFQSRTSSLPIADLNKNRTIGILMEKILNDNLTVEIVHAAQRSNFNSYFFTPTDIDYEEMVIRGYFYEDEGLVPKQVQFPDVIFDRLKLRGVENANWVYEELEEIPFTNVWSPHNYKRLNLYAILKSDNSINQYLSSYQEVNRTRDIFQFLEKYSRVILRENKAGFPLYISRLLDGKYLFTNSKPQQLYNEIQLLNKLKELIDEGKYIVQRDNRLTDNNEVSYTINLHIIKDATANWKSSSIYLERETDMLEEMFEDNIDIIIKTIEDMYSLDASSILSDVRDISEKVARKLDSQFRNISELNITFGIRSNSELCILEVDPSGPNKIYHAIELAENIMLLADNATRINP
ncbi:YheC/YheD family protein [Ornithinibacillus bavariensis]|uniref:DUF8042 domain-containing protein n=1 Tax=Ornithinibacillus bavariensis TaxID=545502 RepID=A0A920C589_9BACI|nr:YheC/YheD family protein [Ornithinibacillus bavariensis]GIO26470.1 hypothetical protein J43TS3_10810 [Ornithinibacillus bavariensis]